MLVTERQDGCDRLTTIALAHGVRPSKTLDRERDALFLDLQDHGTGASFDLDYSSRTVKTFHEMISLYEKAASEDTSPDVRSFAAAALPQLHHDYDDIQAINTRLRGKLTGIARALNKL